MANYYYVKSGGTATGDAGRVAGTPSTGSFADKGATSYYNNIVDALAATTPPVEGDFILCSHLHSHDYGASTTFTFPAGVSVIVTSVNDAALDQYLVGATEKATGANFLNLSFSGQVIQHGMTYIASNTFETTGAGSSMRLYDCDITITQASNGKFGTYSPENVLHMFGGFIRSAYTGTLSYLIYTNTYRNEVKLHGVTVTAAGVVTSLIRTIVKGSHVMINGGSLPAATNILDTNSQDMVNVMITNAALGAFTARYTGTLKITSDLHISGCDTGNKEDADLSVHGEITVDTDTAIYRAAGNPYQAGFAYKFTSAANCGLANPARYHIATLWADTSTAKTFTVQIVRDNATALTDDQIYLEVLHSDDTTTAALRETDQASDILNGTAQPTSTVAWTGTSGFTNENKQELSVTTAQTGKAGLVEVYVNILAPSETIYVCPKVDVA